MHERQRVKGARDPKKKDRRAEKQEMQKRVREEQEMQEMHIESERSKK